MTPEERARFRAGEPAIFRTLVTEHSPRLLGLCRGFAQDTDEAHDLVQETWVRVFEKRRSYRGGSFPAWLFTVCRRVCLSGARSRTTARAPGVDPDTLEDRSADSSPARGAIRSEIRSSIARALLDLPARQREVVVHRLIEGLSTRETAAAMGCAEGTVKAALHHAVTKLAQPLGPHRPADVNPDTRPMGAVR